MGTVTNKGGQTRVTVTNKIGETTVKGRSKGYSSDMKLLKDLAIYFVPLSTFLLWEAKESKAFKIDQLPSRFGSVENSVPKIQKREISEDYKYDLFDEEEYDEEDEEFARAYDERYDLKRRKRSKDTSSKLLDMSNIDPLSSNGGRRLLQIA